MVDPRITLTKCIVDVLDVTRDGHCVPGFAADLLVDIHDDGQYHVKHEQHDQGHEDPNPRCGGAKILSGKIFPTELIFHGNLEASGKCSLHCSKVLKTTAEHHHTSDREGDEGGDEDDHEMQKVGRHHLDRLRDNCQPGLPLQGDETTHHEEQVGIGDAKADKLEVRAKLVSNVCKLQRLLLRWVCHVLLQGVLDVVAANR
mmetsp:Transcript_105715/g.264695  ORF Transcript_105715/g.264695 Transcript_105715/m.264695 type:complete len:201 (+) Transcript_105715:905-1507(+)